MLSSKRGHGEYNKDRINRMHRTASQFQFFLVLYFFFYCDYFSGTLPLGETKSEKTSQKIPEMGIILEFVGNPRNSSQGMIT